MGIWMWKKYKNSINLILKINSHIIAHIYVEYKIWYIYMWFNDKIRLLISISIPSNISLFQWDIQNPVFQLIWNTQYIILTTVIPLDDRLLEFIPLFICDFPFNLL